jgi:hypothetical protein
MIIGTSNYLNYGDSLEMLKKIDFSQYPNLLQKKELIEALRKGKNGNRYIFEIIKDYGDKRSKKINVKKLKNDIPNSFELRKKFKTLGCRGFSFKIHDQISLCGDPLRESINLRIALMPDEDIFYPPRIKRYLRRVQNNHYFCNGFPSIAFCLGSITEEASYLFVIQSDIAYRKPSYLREHFRGWRKILFYEIVDKVLNKTRVLYLCRSQDIINCCHPRCITPQKIPGTWRETYEGTAAYFKMKPVRLSKAVNIQTFQDIKPVYTNIFYKLDLNQKNIINVKEKQDGRTEFITSIL